MIEIWTEDNTVGFRFMKLINKYYLNSQYKVVSHLGNGDDIPNSYNKNGGILNHLKRENLHSKFIILFVDKVIDNPDVMVEYREILKIKSKHKENIFIIDMHSFETCMLSYSNINDITGCKNIDIDTVRKDFINAFSDGVLKASNMSIKLKNYILKINKSNSEKIAKNILAEVTNVASYINKKQMYLSLINGGKAGACWFNDCCIITMNSCYRKCNISDTTSLNEKVMNLVLESYFINIVNQITKFTNYIIENRYICKSANEEYYMGVYNIKQGDNFIKDVGKLLENNNYWNYERLYRQLN